MAVHSKFIGETKSQPAGGRQRRQLGCLLAGLFLFVAADTFSNPILPLYALTLPGTIFGLSREMAASLPVSGFWLAVAATQLFTGWWERGRDHRFLLIASMLLSSTGLALAAIAGNLPCLVICRSLSGLGYGVVLILAQDGILRAHGPSARTRASGLYLSLFFGGTILGTLSGSFLASRFGYEWAFWGAMALSLAAAAIAGFAAPYREVELPAPFRPHAVLRNPRLVGLVLFAAIPSRVINSGYTFFLVPLYLHQIGTPPVLAGQVIMLYALVLATCTQFWSWVTDRTGRPLIFTLVGMGVSGAAMLMIPALPNHVGAVALSVVLLGLGQSIGMSPQVTVLFGVAEAEMSRYGRTAILGVYRVCERVGLFCGPVIAAWLLGYAGQKSALIGFAAMMAVSMLLLIGVFAGRPSRPRSVFQQQKIV
jgi:MFS family permease